MSGLQLFLDRVATPIGELLVVADGEGCVCAVGFDHDHASLQRTLCQLHQASAVDLEPRADPGGARSALDAYFGGDLAAIDRLRVRTGGTPFQRLVWGGLRTIPCGSTTSYSELARRIGRPAAVRAVGLANGSNPIAIVVPCHRVIGANGALTGYGGGLERKEWLLRHERALPGSRLF